MPSILTYREPRLLPEGPDVANALSAPAAGRAPAPTVTRARVGLRPTTVSVLLHAVIIILILVDLRDWWMQTPAAPPPTIEVTLVQPPPPPPPPAPKPVVKPPEPAPPPPAVPLSSDAMSEGAKRPSPADKAEA